MAFAASLTVYVTLVVPVVVGMPINVRALALNVKPARTGDKLYVSGAPPPVAAGSVSVLTAVFTV